MSRTVLHFNAAKVTKPTEWTPYTNLESFCSANSVTLSEKSEIAKALRSAVVGQDGNVVMSTVGQWNLVRIFKDSVKEARLKGFKRGEAVLQPMLEQDKSSAEYIVARAIQLGIAWGIPQARTAVRDYDVYHGFLDYFARMSAIGFTTKNSRKEFVQGLVDYIGDKDYEGLFSKPSVQEIAQFASEMKIVKERKRKNGRKGLKPSHLPRLRATFEVLAKLYNLSPEDFASYLLENHYLKDKGDDSTCIKEIAPLVWQAALDEDIALSPSRTSIDLMAYAVLGFTVCFKGGEEEGKTILVDFQSVEIAVILGNAIEVGVLSQEDAMQVMSKQGCVQKVARYLWYKLVTDHGYRHSQQNLQIMLKSWISPLTNSKLVRFVTKGWTLTEDNHIVGLLLNLVKKGMKKPNASVLARFIATPSCVYDKYGKVLDGDATLHRRSPTSIIRHVNEYYGFFAVSFLEVKVPFASTSFTPSTIKKLSKLGITDKTTVDEAKTLLTDANVSSSRASRQDEEDEDEEPDEIEGDSEDESNELDLDQEKDQEQAGDGNDSNGDEYDQLESQSEDDDSLQKQSRPQPGRPQSHPQPQPQSQGSTPRAAAAASYGSSSAQVVVSSSSNANFARPATSTSVSSKLPSKTTHLVENEDGEFVLDDSNYGISDSEINELESDGERGDPQEDSGFVDGYVASRGQELAGEEMEVDGGQGSTAEKHFLPSDGSDDDSLDVDHSTGQTRPSQSSRRSRSPSSTDSTYEFSHNRARRLKDEAKEELARSLNRKKIKEARKKRKTSTARVVDSEEEE